MSGRVKVRTLFEDGGSRLIRIHDTASPLADELALNDIPLNTRCGGRGLCHGCEVELLAGRLESADGGVTAPCTVQACRVRAESAAAIRIPARSLIEHQPHVEETFAIGVPCAHQPLFPAEGGTGDTAFAVDIGTTTVALLLVDLATGGILSTVGGLNRQVRFGDNVLTRIESGRDPANRAALQRVVVAGTVQPLLVEACRRAGRSMDRIAGGAVAGNTTMLHLLVGEDPTPLGVAPFTPRFTAGHRVTAGELGLLPGEIRPGTPLQLLPGIAAYIGADIAAGVHATGMLYRRAPSLLVDMGTNGEMVLQVNDRLLACATAAGPAFEGCGLSCGSRARRGAVGDLHVVLDPFATHPGVLGGVDPGKADGICGSAYVDFLATARRAGLLAATGRFETAAWTALPEEHRWVKDGVKAVRLIADTPLRISEVDVALLLQAKAAIGAGIEILLETAGLPAADLGTVYVAGGFGMHLDIRHAIDIGLLPGISEAQVRVVGNSSLAGALLALVDRTTLDELETLRGRVEVVELNLADGFEDRYIDHLSLA